MAVRVSARMLLRKFWRSALVAMFAAIESTVPASRASIGATSAAEAEPARAPAGKGNGGALPAAEEAGGASASASAGPAAKRFAGGLNFSWTCLVRSAYTTHEYRPHESRVPVLTSANGVIMRRDAPRQ
eukprot:14753578-Alexandrium_andersonii.AAC.1